MTTRGHQGGRLYDGDKQTRRLRYPAARWLACCPRAASVPLRLRVRHRSFRVSGRAIFAKGKNMESCCGMMELFNISRREAETQSREDAENDDGAFSRRHGAAVIRRRRPAAGRYALHMWHAARAKMRVGRFIGAG